PARSSTLSLHDALPISQLFRHYAGGNCPRRRRAARANSLVCGGCDFGDTSDSCFLPRECPMPVRSPQLTSMIALGACLLILISTDRKSTRLNSSHLGIS